MIKHLSDCRKDTHMKISSDIHANMDRFHSLLDVSTNFDIVYHTVEIGGKQACIYFVDGFTKDEVLQRLIQSFIPVKPEDMPENAHDFAKKYVTYGETGLVSDEEQILIQLLSGLSCLFIDGYDQCITVDCRTYPARGVSEPEKDKVLRGSRDGFVETLIFNTALIRRGSGMSILRWKSCPPEKVPIPISPSAT